MERILARAALVACLVTRFKEPQLGHKLYFRVSDFRDALKIIITGRSDSDGICRNWKARMKTCCAILLCEEDGVAGFRSEASMKFKESQEKECDESYKVREVKLGRDCLADWTLAIPGLVLTFCSLEGVLEERLVWCHQARRCDLLSVCEPL